MSTESIQYDQGERLRRPVSLCAFTKEQARQNPELQRYYDEFMQLRTDFVRQEGWLPDQEHDHDAYDDDHETHYVISLDEEGEVSAGLRLTRNLNLGDNLSLSMWDGPQARKHTQEEYGHLQERLENHRQLILRGAIDPDQDFIDSNTQKIEQYENDTRIVQQFAEAQDLLAQLEEKAANGEVWDLTRLVTRGSLNEYSHNIRERHRAYQDVIKLLGATIAVAGEQSLLVFTASQRVYEFLAHGHMEVHQLVHGRISVGDTDEAHLCVTDIASTYDKMQQEYPRGARLVAAGRDTVEVV